VAFRWEVTLLALFVFGAIKGHYTGVKPLRGGFQTVLVGRIGSGGRHLGLRD